MSAREVLDRYISFFEKNGHKRIENSSLVPKDDPSTLFTSSGMQPLIKYLLGDPHPEGKRLVNVQNCFRAQDIEEVGDNRHTTFFRMLGNWSLGDYFKKEQIPWFWELLTKELELDPNRLYVSVFEGYKNIKRDEESAEIWRELFKSAGIDPEGRIFYCGVSENWWSRSGLPDDMPAGEPGGPDTEVYFDFSPEKGKVESLEEESKNGRLLEIGNSVFMTYRKTESGDFQDLPQKNVDFGGGLERILAAIEQKQDIFKTSLFWPIIEAVEKITGKKYEEDSQNMRIIADHFIAASFMIANNVTPSNKLQGSVLRRFIRRAIDRTGANFEVGELIRAIVSEYGKTDAYLEDKYELIKLTIEQEHTSYKRALGEAKKFIEKKEAIKIGDELKGVTKISSDTAFISLTTYGLGPTQLKSLGVTFNEAELAEKIKEHQQISKKGVK